MSECKHGWKSVTCDDCATEQQNRAELERLRAEVKDLRERLTEVRALTKYIRRDDYWPELERATNLRNKNWRQP